MSQKPSILRRFVCALLIALFAAVLVLPLFQQITGIPADQELLGFRPGSSPFPSWTLRGWLNGSFAAETDSWIRDHIGLRGWLIKSNRQLRYTLFGQVEPAPLRRRALIVGKKGILHENIYLTEALRDPVVPPERMETFAESLARLQNLLKEQGMAFLVIAAPNKARLYPDTLPSWAPPLIRTPSDYEAFLDALERHDVPVLDTMALFDRLRGEQPDLVAPHGTHWSFNGAWVALQQAIPLINAEDILPELPVPRTVELATAHPAGMDDELRGQLNLFAGEHLKAVPGRYPVASEPPEGFAPFLNVLIVGDSYGFGLMDALARSRLCRKIDYWFYMLNIYELEPASFDSREKRILQSPAPLGRFQSNDANGRRFLEGKNLVILVMTAFNIDKYTWGFDRMINRLYGDPNDNPPLTSLDPLPDLED